MYMAHTNAWGSKSDFAVKKVKRQHRTIILGILVDLLSTIICANLCKDKGPGLILFWRKRFLKVFTIYRQCRHFGQWTMTKFAIFHSPAPRRRHLKFEQHWPRGFRGGHLKLSTFFSIQMYGAHTNAYGSKLYLAIKMSNDNVRTSF